MINYSVLLADDDDDDCQFFKDALDELPVDVSLNTVNNGAELMHFLQRHSRSLPDILFLDLNMPRKSGLECLAEIKQSEKLRRLPVVIFSTSFDNEVIDQLYDHGAQYYIRKPADFSDLKKVIHKAISVEVKQPVSRPPKEKFVLSP